MMPELSTLVITTSADALTIRRRRRHRITLARMMCTFLSMPASLVDRGAGHIRHNPEIEP
jgi:hypothetical protein